jgi:hypothetical protein
LIKFLLFSAHWTVAIICNLARALDHVQEPRTSERLAEQETQHLTQMKTRRKGSNKEKSIIDLSSDSEEEGEEQKAKAENVGETKADRQKAEQRKTENEQGDEGIATKLDPDTKTTDRENGSLADAGKFLLTLMNIFSLMIYASKQS